jgi:hypothetical protein
MKIILEGDEARAHIDQKVREAILEQTSRFPASMKPKKPRPAPLSDESKAEIKRLHDAGMRRDQIAEKLGLPVMQVGGVVQAYIMNVLRRWHVEPKIEGLQPMQPLVMPEAKKPAIEPTCTSCGKPLGHDKVAIGGKLYCKPCAPKKVPTMITKRPKQIRSNSEIDDLIVSMSATGASVIDMAAAINRIHGKTWMPDDVSKRLKELRT